MLVVSKGFSITRIREGVFDLKARLKPVNSCKGSVLFPSGKLRDIASMPGGIELTR